jgi:hypothetical protein
MSKITAGTGFEKEETTDINYTYDKGKKKKAETHTCRYSLQTRKCRKMEKAFALLPLKTKESLPLFAVRSNKNP